ncbi:hypothetical protein Y032_0009g430 [Ancylostoma ceylanicum]|uniref:Peroxin/Ferlin domain-containing protein n=1 Tax=Ancylostoma ceylanicum TaxID=53326 RepID=A0A016VH16_9BILA|nr:hypothetical protein Y032_0009g430 [Ancylostoma ceylanicum]
MQSVSAGAEGVVWSVAKDGAVYALSSEYSPVAGNIANLALPQKTEILREVVEYQRHAFMRGFVTFQGASSGISAWMEGSVSINGLYDKLPSRQWSWIDPAWVIVGAEKSEGGWTYSDVIDGVYKAEKKRKDRVRRRVWQRRCCYTGRGPWVIVEAPPVSCIEVQKTNADRILVWAVTENGQVLLRQGVTPGHPQGATWKHIISDYNITAISVASPTCVWATTRDGRLLRRECTDQTDMECVDWAEVVYSPMKNVFSFCATRDFVFLLPSSDPELIVVDVKREICKLCLPLPKAVYIAFDHEGNVHYCDGARIVKLERTISLEFYISGNFSVHGCTQFSFI